MDIHPLLVHFPIVLVLTGALVDVVGLIGKREGYAAPAAALFVSGALLTIAAAYTGNLAAERASSLPGIAQDLGRHEDAATYATWLCVVLALARVHLAMRNRFIGHIRILWTVGALAAAGIVVASAYTGGELVYEHGAGTRPAYKNRPEIGDAGAAQPYSPARPNAGITEFKTGTP